MNEVQFTARVTQWIAIILDGYPSLPFAKPDIERKKKGSRKRNDITLENKDGKVVLTGEVKLPYQKDGQSPHNDAVVADARKKAKRFKSPFFFTWNINEFLLWETYPDEDAPPGTCYRSYQITEVHTESQMDNGMAEQAIRKWLRLFLIRYPAILAGEQKIGSKSPDEVFIETVESYLQQPILDTHHALLQLYKQRPFKRQLDGWMQTELGWTVSDDADDIRDQLSRAAKFACYALVIKVVFHEALLKPHGEKMMPLNVPAQVENSEDLRLHLAAFFRQAIQITGDYETVFGEDHSAYGDTIPFKSDKAVSHWRDLIEKIHRFDFSKKDYEVIGNIFERLIDPEERKKYGQYYTSVEVVDLINSFCIRTGGEKILDPACGGGTFLVRAYARKREKMPEIEHVERLKEIFGIDIERFAAHLSTINLATRDLIDAENYPQVARRDFFNVVADKPFMDLPVHGSSNGKMEHRNVSIPELDAVVANPPYIRQEEIPKAKKKAYHALVKDEQKITLSGRSDIHVMFWPHSASFLKPDGYLGFITSSQWLDVEYGFKLQRWMLENFRLLALFESIEEPWFVGARVATTVAILQREADPAKRMESTVRFVQLRRPMREVMAHDGTTGEAVRAADSFRDEVLGLKQNTVNERFRARLVCQGGLWRDGVSLGITMGKSKPAKMHGEEGSNIQSGEYYGGKWGVYLRAPDLWFDLLDEFGEQLKPLGEISSIHRGITSGKDEFFFPVDCSTEMLEQEEDPKEFKQRFSVSRKEIESGKVKLVRCGKGRKIVKPIEAKYLEPEVHSLMEIIGFVVKPENCKRMILLVKTKPMDKLNKHVRAYIEWGESEGYHTGSTCASRVTKEKAWYDLVGHKRGELFWPKSQQYKHAVPLNPTSIQANCNLYDVHPIPQVSATVLGAVLNSSWTVLSKYQYGRPVGVEGMLKTEIVDVNMMLVPDPENASKKTKQRVERAFKKMAKRSALQMLSERRMRRMAFTQADKEHLLEDLSDVSELEMPDRHELDDAVLEMMGVDDAARRKELLDKLYTYLRWFFEETRQKEEKAIANKKRTARKGKANPQEIARQIYKELQDHYAWVLLNYEIDFLRDVMPEVIVRDLPKGAEASDPVEILEGYRVTFKLGRKKHAVILEVPHKEQADLIALLSRLGKDNLTYFPYTEHEARSVYDALSSHLVKREKKLRELIAERTIIEESQDKILEALVKMIRLFF